MGTMRELVCLFIWWVVGTGSSAYAQSPCDVAASHGIRNCQSERVVLYVGAWQGQSRIASDLFSLDPSRLYWACCATDPAGNSSKALQSGSYLAVLPDQRYSDETNVESCAAAIDTSAAQRGMDNGDSVWAPKRRAQAMIVGWSDPALADRPAVCKGPPVQLDASKIAVGAVLLVSVPANAISDEK